MPKKHISQAGNSQ